MTPVRFWLVACGFIAIGMTRIASTYAEFTQTWDEPWHIACGMQLLDQGVYAYETKHPPLARVAAALPLYLAGRRSHGTVGDVTGEGNAILHESGDYWRNLSLARAGILPFFILLCWTVAWWGRAWYDARTALVAVALVSLLPPILGHAGLATTDMACAATVTLALGSFTLWIQQATLRRSALLGGAVALAMLSKFSAGPFLALSFLAAAAWARVRLRWRPDARLSVVVVGCAVAAMWAGYRFEPSFFTLDGEFLGGVRSLLDHSGVGSDAYLLGEYRMTGWWYFFPVVLAVKTPLGFLLLSALAVAPAWRNLQGGRWARGLPLLYAAMILASCLPSRINLGVRHILAIYPVLALLAAHALVLWWDRRERDRRRWKSVRVAALAVLLAESALAHPDYMAWFNWLGGKRPETILVESDLDWGQDLRRLAGRLQELKVEEVAIAYFGTAVLEASGLPRYRVLGPRDQARGWVAASARMVTLYNKKDGSYDWLARLTPVERVGRSIFLYRVP